MHNLCIPGLLLPCPAPNNHPDYTTGHPECSGSFSLLSTYLPEDWGLRTWAQRVLPSMAARAQTLYQAHHPIWCSKRFMFFYHGIDCISVLSRNPGKDPVVSRHWNRFYSPTNNSASLLQSEDPSSSVVCYKMTATCLH